MPISKSAKKAYVSSERKRARNLILERDLKRTLKKADKTNINKVISTVDKAAKTNLISRHRADRLKSRLAKNFGTPKSEKKVVAKPTKKPVAVAPKPKVAKKVVVKTGTKKPIVKPKALK